ncbi:relaxase/mobilization nuclease domain-containing protein [Campylobacter troglodytis]|uniref:relaxase/mobilization nuclease domain-containing protein n=1 Tax=Campylobacter troglodytis TaxID=654363 RepID=UPI00115774DF|nr:hypothetical protein [Campylobacter troglodytis]TQR56261.1 hypothetical protein DMC01_09255 [Campylobacter troglodytis]
MLQLSKEEIKELYKERNEALFFDFKPLKSKKIFIKPNKVIIDKPREICNHFISVGSFLNNYNAIQKNAPKNQYWGTGNSKQVVIKTLSNLDRFGAKNALSYVIRNSSNDYAINQDGEEKSLNEIMSEWSKDFSHKKNSKEVMHLAFCINEDITEYGSPERSLKKAVEAVMQKNFFLYKYAIVIHTHQNKLHAHVLLNKNNIINKQKFHLNNAEFKPFFNQLRNDFALALKANGLKNYVNHYKIENELAYKAKRVRLDNFEKNFNVYKEYNKMELNLERKYKLKDKKCEMFLKDIDLLRAKVEECKEKLSELDSERKSNIENKNFDKTWSKRFNAMVDELKNNYALIKDKSKEVKTLYRESLVLQMHIRRIQKEKYWFEQEQDKEFSSLIEKKKYLDFITNNLERKILTKSELNLKIKDIQNEILLSENSTNEILKERIKASILTSSVLGKKNNAFALTRAYKDLEKNLFLLKGKEEAMRHSITHTGEEIDEANLFYNGYIQRLEENKNFVLDLIHQRFLLLQKELERKKEENKLKSYNVKEFEITSKFLDKKNDKDIERLYELVIDKKDEPKINASETYSSGGGNKQETKTPQENKKEPHKHKTTTQTNENQRSL